jgi:hypothetical protein
MLSFTDVDNQLPFSGPILATYLLSFGEIRDASLNFWCLSTYIRADAKVPSRNTPEEGTDNFLHMVSR